MDFLQGERNTRSKWESIPQREEPLLRSTDGGREIVSDAT